MDNIERMARLLVKAQGRNPDKVVTSEGDLDWQLFGEMAQRLHDLGYTIVPRKATDKMVAALDFNPVLLRNYYEDMITDAELTDV